MTHDLSLFSRTVGADARYRASSDRQRIGSPREHADRQRERAACTEGKKGGKIGNVRWDHAREEAQPKGRCEMARA